MTLQQLNKFVLSHIYTNMTFKLFTHVAPRGSLEHIHICVPSNRSGRSPPGLQSSGSSNFPSRGTYFPTISLTTTFVLQAWYPLWLLDDLSLILEMSQFYKFHERCVTSICRNVNGFINSRNIVQLSSSIIGQPYFIYLDKRCLRSVCQIMTNVQIWTWL